MSFQIVFKTCNTVRSTKTLGQFLPESWHSITKGIVPVSGVSSITSKKIDIGMGTKEHVTIRIIVRRICM